MTPARRSRLLTIAGTVVSVLLLVWAAQAMVSSRQPERGPQRGSVANGSVEIEELLDYNDSISLTEVQEAVRREALEALPAPCCAAFSAATCCCQCNLARATWGLAKHLIADQGYDAVRVRREVAAWHSRVNPGGFNGEACFTGGCERAFHADGCGGMDRHQVVY